MKCEIIIVGAGAAGLMAARELGKARKKVIILEARNRIGGLCQKMSLVMTRKPERSMCMAILQS